MNIYPDTLMRLNRLVELSEDPKIVNEDGTSLDPLAEITAEVVGKKREHVLKEDITRVNNALMAHIQRRQARGSPFA